MEADKARNVFTLYHAQLLHSNHSNNIKLPGKRICQIERSQRGTCMLKDKLPSHNDFNINCTFKFD